MTRARKATPLIVLLASCTPVDDVVVPDGPRELRVRGPEAADDELLSELRLDQAFALPDHGVLLAEGSQLSVLRPGGEVEDLGDEPGAITAMARFGAATILAAERGLFTLDSAGLHESPLNEALTEHNVTALASGGRSLWIGTEQGLLRWRDGALTTVEPDGLPLTGPTLAPAVLEEGEGVWVASEGALYAVVDDGGLVAHIEADVSPHAMATDASGSLWCADGDQLLRRQPDGGWDVWNSDVRVDVVVARTDRSEVWLQTAEGLVLFDGVDFRGTEESLVGDLVDMDGLGRALVLHHTLLRRSLDRPLLRLGAPSGALEEATTVSLFPTAPELVTTVTASLDGAAAEALSAAWTVDLDPLDMDEGPHQVDLVVSYSDREDPVTASLSFGVGAYEIPTWSGDIQPMHDASCGECHDPGQSARLLSTRAQWEAEFDLILDNVQQQLMPLPPNDPLTPAEIQAIQAWASGGFPE